MVDVDKDSASKDKKQASFSVSSTPARPNRYITFNVPEVKRPEFNSQKLRNPKEWGINTLIALFLLVTLAVGYTGAWIETRSSEGGVTFANLSNQEKIVTNQSQLINQIAKSVGPSVVSVNVNITSTSSGGGFGLFGIRVWCGFKDYIYNTI